MLYGKMTNEELVYKIQNGKTEYIETLWLQIETFVRAQAWKYCPLESAIDDMMQESFFFMVESVEKFDASKEKTYVSYFATYYMKKGFKKAIWGSISDGAENNPTLHAVSLDIPIDEEGVTTLGELQQDDNAEDPFREIENADSQKTVAKVLLAKIAEIQDEEVREIVKAYYLYPESKKLSCERFNMGRSKYDARLKKGLNLLKCKLQGISEEEKEQIGLYTQRFYRDGLTRYKENLFTSQVELAAIKNT